MVSERERPQCQRCQHYYITHDVRFPYGCRALGFKGKRPPMLDVVNASGESCLYFQARDYGSFQR